jgi:hypothetical protein
MSRDRAESSGAHRNRQVTFLVPRDNLILFGKPNGIRELWIEYKQK